MTKNFFRKIKDFAVSYKNKFRYLHVSSNSIEKLEKHEINALVLLSIEEPKELCDFLKMHIYKLEHFINNPQYKQYIIPKKKGGIRKISEPEYFLKRIQKRLNYYFQAYYLIVKPREVHGFVVNPHYLGTYCNIAENAKMHVKKKCVLNIDIADFFPSITAKQVKNVFEQYFLYNQQVATALTLLTTYKGKLPTGAPTSPVLSNFVCMELDKNLNDFCKMHDITYSRYADDLTFSANYEISTDNILDIINLIMKRGFRINEKKLRMKKSNRRQIVTGLTVNEKVNIDRKI